MCETHSEESTSISIIIPQGKPVQGSALISGEEGAKGQRRLQSVLWFFILLYARTDAPTKILFAEASMNPSMTARQ